MTRCLEAPMNAEQVIHEAIRPLLGRYQSILHHVLGVSIPFESLDRRSVDQDCIWIFNHPSLERESRERFNSAWSDILSLDHRIWKAQYFGGIHVFEINYNAERQLFELMWRHDFRTSWVFQPRNPDQRKAEIYIFPILARKGKEQIWYLHKSYDTFQIQLLWDPQRGEFQTDSLQRAFHLKVGQPADYPDYIKELPTFLNFMEDLRQDSHVMTLSEDHFHLYYHFIWGLWDGQVSFQDFWLNWGFQLSI